MIPAPHNEARQIARALPAPHPGIISPWLRRMAVRPADSLHSRVIADWLQSKRGEQKRQPRADTLNECRFAACLLIATATVGVILLAAAGPGAPRPGRPAVPPPGPLALGAIWLIVAGLAVPVSASILGLHRFRTRWSQMWCAESWMRGPRRQRL